MVKYLISFQFHYSDISILGGQGFTLQVIFENYLKIPRTFWPQGVYSTAMSLEWLFEYSSIEKSCVESNASLQKNDFTNPDFICKLEFLNANVQKQ